MKRLLSIVLSLVLLMGVMPITVFASNKSDTDVTRDTVLILDNSVSMEGEPLTALKRAAIKFCDSVFSAEGNNRVALVVYDTNVAFYSDFTNSITELTADINSMDGNGSWTNISAAVKKSDELLSNSSADIKNIVLMTDGVPTAGEHSSSGQYSYNDYDSTSNAEYYCYEYANSLYNITTSLFNKYSVYTLGFFHNVSDYTKSFASKVLNDIQNAGYYEVTDPDELEFIFGEVADDIVNKLKEITFTYPSGGEKTATCYYTNDYFAESSYVYNPSLATMSMSFAWSAFGSSKGGTSDYTNKSINAKKLLMDIGVDETQIDTNEWFTVKPTTDSIGVVAGNMPITVKGEDYTLIALAVRGGGYEQEWASNFTLGKYGQHSGFDTAKNNVINFLKSYVVDHNITGPVKFWITGYSRAAATANLVGGAIDKGAVISENISYAYDDVYTYCFETPAGAITSEVKGQAGFKNIFNIINSSDLVPYVAPAALGFGRYGVDRYLPTAESSGSKYSKLKANMLKIYNSLGSTDGYIVDDFQMKKVALKNWLPGGEEISYIQDDYKNNFSQGLFLSNYVTIISKEFIKTRSNYVDRYQDDIREICSIVFNCTDEQLKILIDSVTNQAKENVGKLIWSYFWNSEEEALQIVSDWIKNGLNDAGMTDYDEAAVDKAVINLSDLLLAVGSNHPNYFATAVSNGKGLPAAHYPELCYSWLASMDDNYIDGAKSELNNGGYRIIRINCAVDVEVFDNAGNTVAAIVNEQPVDIDESTYICGIDEDGQKFVVLPVDTDYKISITGREDGKVNYSINEYCALAGDYTRNINYFNIDLKQGEKISGIIPAYDDSEIEQDTPNGSNADYALFDSSDKKIAEDSDFSGTTAQKSFNVNAQSSDSEYGIVTGSGTRGYGTFAQLEAIPSEGCSFVGWFEGETCVSTENPYRICVTEDINLTAKFEKEGDASASLTLDKENAELDIGKTLTLKATVTPGSSNWTKADKLNYGGALTWAKRDSLTSDKFTLKAADSAVETASGYTGYAVWKLYNDGTLVVSGNGNMRNYDYASETPWYSHAAEIKQIIIENGVTAVGSFAFNGLANLKAVSLADSVTYIGNYAFKNCANLERISVSDNLEVIGDSAFYGCAALKNITIPAAATNIADYAFSRAGLTEIKFLGNAPKIEANAFSKVTATAYYSATIADAVIGWTSSDTNVATVDSNGIVTAVSEGMAVITATTKNGLTASCEITVLAPATLKITDNNKILDEVYYVKVPNVFADYKSCSATLGFEIDRAIDIASVKWSYANWSVDNPEADIETPDNYTTVIRPNGRGIGARSTWIQLTVTDTDGNVYTDTVKVRFYKWSWQVH